MTTTPDISSQNQALHAWLIPVVLLSSILLGGLWGYFFRENIHYLKPLGDIFLNLIFTAIVPLIFFSVSSAIAQVGSLGKLGKIMSSMAAVFLFTGFVTAVYTIGVVLLFPPAEGVALPLTTLQNVARVSMSDQLAGIITVPEFANLFSHEHILALILFSMLVGISAIHSKEKGTLFIAFLQSGEAIFMRFFSLIMYYAPIGFFAYFAVLVSELGPTLMESYLRIAIVYYLAALLYFLVAFSAYAWLAGKKEGVTLFWRNIFLPVLTSIATCSSAASIPANLIATKKMRVAPEICETVVPLGAIIHKDGSVMGGIFKIAFLFGIFHLSFSSLPVLLTALGVSMLVGTVMGAIPGGGMLGELLILNVYGFPPSFLMTVAAISIIIDPMATLLNVTGNTVSSMMVARLVGGKP